MCIPQIFYKRGTRLVLCIVLLVLLAVFLTPSPVVAGGCSCGGISLIPDSGKVGTMVVLAVTSDAFPIEGDYEICWSPTPAFTQDKTSVLAKGHASRDNTAITHTFTIPEAEGGMRYIRLRDYKNSVTLQFFVRPNIKANPNTALPGSAVTVTGQGFPAKTAGTLALDGILTNVPITTNDVGSFTAEFTVRNTAIAGEREISVIDGGFSAITSAKLEILPMTTSSTEPINMGTNDASVQAQIAEHDGPRLVLEHNNSQATPTPLTPLGNRYGILGTQLVTFTWGEVPNAGDTTYTLEISDDYEFSPSSLVTRRTKIPKTSWAVSIAPGTYYWRIKAVDGDGNESEWGISPYPFEVGSFSIWQLIIGGLVCLLLLILVVRAFFRRQKKDYYY